MSHEVSRILDVCQAVAAVAVVLSLIGNSLIAVVMAWAAVVLVIGARKYLNHLFTRFE